jgi:hypothetical protein
MHRFFTISLVLLLVNIFVSRAQEHVSDSQEFSKVLFGIKGGMNISSFSASINSESRAKAGLTLGIYLKKQIGPKLFFRPELYYSNQGQKDNYLFPYGGPSIGSTTTSMHYLNVPLLFELGNKISFQFGGQLGILLAGTENGTVASVKVDNKLNDVMTKADFALVVGAGYSLNRHFNSGVRFNYGVTNIYSPDKSSGLNVDLPKVHNRVLHFYVAYSF